MDSKIEALKDCIQKEKSLDSICEALELKPYAVMGLVSELKSQGNNVLEVKRNGELYIVNYGDKSINKSNAYHLVTDDFVVKLAFISDTRLGSKYQQLSILNDIYKKANDYGVKNIIHCGDISEGTYYGANGLYVDTLFAQDEEEQTNYIVDNYPYVEGITTHFVTGEHDQTHLKKNKVDIGKNIAKEREDMNYLGANSGEIIINNSDNINATSIRVLHPKGKIPYTISYHPQQFISAMRSEDKTDILLHGHWLQSEHMYFRNIDEFSVPSVVATTPEMIDRGDQNCVGAWFITLFLNKKYKLEKIVPMFIPYYKTIENDYQKVKTLRIGGNK